MQRLGRLISHSDVDPKILARGTPGFSGADLQNMVKCVFVILLVLVLFYIAQQSGCHPSFKGTGGRSLTETF
jgi:ATP-dependent Zn protease